MAETLKDLSDALAAVAENAGPAVVHVEGRRRGPSSGVVYADAVVVTASHVLEWDEGITIGLPDGGTARAQVAGRDPGTDLAALRVEGAGALTPAGWVGADGVKAGHLVLGLSRPGSRVRVGLGVVSVCGEEWWTPAGGRIDHDVHLDIGLHPGFSGGALVDGAGGCLGVTTAGLLRGTPTLVPTATVRRVVESLLAHGHVRRAFLGIGTQGVRLPADLAKSLGRSTGLLVVSVQPDTPAAAAGLLLGDVLLGFDGSPLHHPGELYPLLDEGRIGQAALLKVLRAGRLQDVSVTAGARP